MSCRSLRRLMGRRAPLKMLMSIYRSVRGLSENTERTKYETGQEMKPFGTNLRATIFAFAVASLPGGAEARSNDPVERNMANPICETFSVKDVSRVPPGHEPSGAESSSLGFTRSSRIFGAGNNGWINTPYSRTPALERSRPGDRVLVCLVKYYVGCPKGDDRGRTYSVRNLRTGATFEAMNGSHICGGA